MNKIISDRRASSAEIGGRTALERLAYSVSEAATASGLGRTTLYALIGQGVLPSCKIGKRRVIRCADLEALVAGHLNQAT